MPALFRIALDQLDRTVRSKPLLFIALAWIAGILLADHWAAAPAVAGGLGLALGLSALAVRERWTAQFLLHLAVAGLALAATRLAWTPPRGDISEWVGRQIAVSGTLADEPRRSCDNWRCTLSCHWVRYGRQLFPVRGRLSVSTHENLSSREPGDRVIAFGIPDRPTGARNPGGFSAALSLAEKGVFASMLARPGAIVLSGPANWTWRRWAALLRRRIAESNRRIMPDPKAAALVNSLLLGERNPDDEQAWNEEKDSFSRTGLYHVLVVDGAKVALLFALLSAWRRWALRARPNPRRGRWRLVRASGGYSQRQALGFGLVLLALYVPLVGLQSTILRATLVVIIFTLARWLDRETEPENSLAGAALILLVANPLTLFDLSFQFSFAGVWGMIRGTGPLENVFCMCVRPIPRKGSDRGSSLATAPYRPPGRILTLTALLLSAQLATAPLQAYYFQTVSLIGPLANPPVVILSTLLIPVGMASSLLAALLDGIPGAQTWAHGISWPTEQLARLMNGMATAFASPRSATVLVLPPGWVEIALYSLLLLLATTAFALRRRFVSPAAFALALAVLINALLRPAWPVSTPTLTFIDVGQGDGCLVRLPGGATMLVDGGGSPRAPCVTHDCSDAAPGRLADSIRTDCTDIGRDILLRFLRYEHIRRIDLLVLTHPHDDHLWGLDALLDPRQRFQVGQVLDTGRPLGTPAWREWQALLQRRHLTPITARRGMRLTLGPAMLSVLSPPPAFFEGSASDPDNNHVVNNNSIVLRMDVAGSRVLLTGDAEAEAEAAMAGEDVQADVLKVGHHGSAYSTSDAWLDRVRPRLAVISCGRHNPFGHPSPDTLARLQHHDVQVYRTDQDGAVTLEMRPDGWTASTALGGEGSNRP